MVGGGAAHPIGDGFGVAALDAGRFELAGTRMGDSRPIGQS